LSSWVACHKASSLAPMVTITPLAISRHWLETIDYSSTLLFVRKSRWRQVECIPCAPDWGHLWRVSLKFLPKSLTYPFSAPP
jgi:hypothetical protein